MDKKLVTGRIYARKILLTYFYEQYFLENAGKKTRLLEEIEKIQKSIYEANTEEIDLQSVMRASYYDNIDEEITYITKYFFDNIVSQDIDWSYITRVWSLFWKYEDAVRQQVNKHIVSFSYDDMDLIDRILFVLWYIEFLVIKTPKEVVLNEMIELAKRYGDEQSPKLLNGIGHKILTDIEKWSV